MRNYLITGGLGYVGHQLAKLLSQDQNNKITVTDNRFLPDIVQELTSRGIQYYQRDIFNIKDLIEKKDIIYNLAGITEVNLIPSQATPEKDAEIIKIGTEGTRYIINNLSFYQKLIFASTQVVYDGLTEEKLNITEEEKPCPLVSYSQSKYQSELDLFESNKNFVICRFASVYGMGGSSMRWKILPNLFSKMASQDQDLKVFGAENLKPLIALKDLIRALDFLDKQNYNKEIYHLVNENAKVIDIANICKECNPKININIVNQETPNKGFSLSNEKLLKTGFQFKYNLKDEIKEMINLWSNKSINSNQNWAEIKEEVEGKYENKI